MARRSPAQPLAHGDPAGEPVPNRPASAAYGTPILTRMRSTGSQPLAPAQAQARARRRALHALNFRKAAMHAFFRATLGLHRVLLSVVGALAAPVATRPARRALPARPCPQPPVRRSRGAEGRGRSLPATRAQAPGRTQPARPPLMTALFRQAARGAIPPGHWPDRTRPSGIVSAGGASPFVRRSEEVGRSEPTLARRNC
jgi:hypothetical protein